ncbi:MAG: MazG family protein, partial [Pseudomonadota bacterium]
NPVAAAGAAAAIECIHAYSLVHDDLPCMDDDALRRGQPTVHRKWDEATAVLAGDGLQALAFELLVQAECGPRAKLNLVMSLANAAGVRGMVGGQAADMAAETADAPLDLHQIMDLQAGKTGALISWSALVGPRMAEEERTFTFDDVANSISDKMEARHPHIFGSEGGTMEETRWEALKAAERDNKGMQSALDGVALALPALMRAQKLQKRAARTGFDWPDPTGSEAKIIEETDELNAATSESEKVEEAGDLLFAAVNFVRAHGIDAEEALRAANSKFERRFRGMETLADGGFSALSLDEMEKLWQAVKADEKAGKTND